MLSFCLAKEVPLCLHQKAFCAVGWKLLSWRAFMDPGHLILLIIIIYFFKGNGNDLMVLQKWHASCRVHVPPICVCLCMFFFPSKVISSRFLASHSGKLPVVLSSFLIILVVINVFLFLANDSDLLSCPNVPHVDVTIQWTLWFIRNCNYSTRAEKKKGTFLWN